MQRDAQEPARKRLLSQFTGASLKAWDELNASLDSEHAGKIADGYYYFSARVSGKSKGLDASEILTSLEQTPKYTGWPAFVILNQADTRPRVVGGGLQAWTAKCTFPDVSFSDFWRITPTGEFFLLRGYDEDASKSGSGNHREPALVLSRRCRFGGLASSCFVSTTLPPRCSSQASS